MRRYDTRGPVAYHGPTYGCQTCYTVRVAHEKRCSERFDMHFVSEFIEQRCVGKNYTLVGNARAKFAATSDA